MVLTAAATVHPYSDPTVSGASAPLRSEPAQQIPVVKNPSGAKGDLAKDKVTLSETGRRYSRQGRVDTKGEEMQSQSVPQDNKKTNPAAEQISVEEQQTVQKLKQRDREVRTHEQAHLANAGQYAAGGPSYSYQTGPDGRKYAVGGEVPIDVSKERTPEQTLQKMRVIQRAALAPANPSSADRNIAAAAGMKEAEAMQEISSMQSPTSSIEPSEENKIDNSSTELSPENKTEHPIRRQDFQAIYA